MSEGHLARPHDILASGVVDRIGTAEAAVYLTDATGESFEQRASVANHDAALRQAIDMLTESGLLDREEISATGHRVVHGGTLFTGPTLVDEDVISAIDSLTELAPLHNGPALVAIRSAKEIFGESTPMVAVFDTAFHATLPQHAALYAIPRELAEKHKIRRYGFHGLAHRYMMERYARITSTPIEQVDIVTLQLGNGCSAAAIKGGKSVDTSMGFTPLEGLIMGTRSGDIDPAVVSYIAKAESVDRDEVEGWLNGRSGLLGVSGLSRDMRELLKAESRGDQAASLAITMFCYRARKYLGAYMAALGGAQAVVFGGGIGENAPSVRERICEDFAWCGLTIDSLRNSSAVGREERISTAESTIQAYVVPVDEADIIIEDAIRCLNTRRSI
jgi:acetate kinase